VKICNKKKMQVKPILSTFHMWKVKIPERLLNVGFPEIVPKKVLESAPPSSTRDFVSGSKGYVN
jgi:hypothetical protein